MKGIAVAPRAGGRRDFFWLNQNFAMNASSPQRGLGFNLNFGGIFTSPPVAVSTLARPPIVGPIDPPPINPAPFAEGDAGAEEYQDAFGTDVADLPEAGETNRLDLFGLGLDYALYHKRLWGSFDQNDLTPWRRLGGVFISAPSAIVWGGRLDVFGLGTDHALFTKRSTQGPVLDRWTPDWQRLGGTFTSAASLVSRAPDRLDLFIRGADFTLRTNHTDGNSWFGWQNLGGQLASPPVAVSWGPDRIDVFALFRDGALWHRWFDGEFWNDWESLGGSWASEPAALALGPGRIEVFAVNKADRKLGHYRFANQTWSIPDFPPIGTTGGLAEAPAVIATGANRFEVILPCDNQQIRILTWDGQGWSFGSAGAQFRMPWRYRFSVDHVKVVTTRALNSDTDAAAMTVAAGNAVATTKTQWIGSIGGVTEPKSSQTNLLNVRPVTVDLAEPMSFSYIVVNNGHGDKAKILTALQSAGDALSIAGSSSMQEDIAKGVVKFVSVKIVAALSVPVVGSIVSLISSWLLDKLSSAIFKSCDGIVAVEMRAMLGKDLYLLTDSGRKTVTVTTVHPGTNSPSACGANSKYEVTWTIAPL